MAFHQPAGVATTGRERFDGAQRYPPTDLADLAFGDEVRRIAEYHYHDLPDASASRHASGSGSDRLTTMSRIHPSFRHWPHGTTRYADLPAEIFRREQVDVAYVRATASTASTVCR